MEADARTEARASAATAAAASLNGEIVNTGESNTFEPGEGKSAEESFATQFTLEEKAKIREMVANADSPEEIDRIEGLVKRGIFPGSSTTAGGGGNGEKKKSADVGGEDVENSAKKQRSE